MATYLYPEARELRQIGADLVHDMTLNDPLLGRVMPITRVNAPLLQWSVDADDQGLQQLRGLDGAPVHVQPLGKTEYLAEPGYFGEFETITERELNFRGGSVIGEATADISDLVVSRQRQLIKREVTRMRQVGWTLLTTGTFSVAGKGSTLTFTDTFALQTYAASDWSTVATATPLADFRGMQLEGAEFGVTFGTGAVAVMNRVTANRMFSNTNAADLGGKRLAGTATITGQDDVNKILMGDGLPPVVIMDDGYKNDSGTFTKFIADDIVVVLGTRDAGDRIGELRMTRNMVNPNGAPGSYDFIKDYVRGVNAPKSVPPKIEIHRGSNWGVVIFRPKAISIMSV